MFSFSICNEGIKTVEDKTVTTKMEVHANELFTITLTNRKGIHHFWRLANQEDLNKNTIQFVTTLEKRRRFHSRYMTRDNPLSVNYYFFPEKVSNVPIKIEFILRNGKGEVLNQKIYEVTVKEALPKKEISMKVKANQPFIIRLEKSIKNKKYVWDLGNKEQLNTTLIKFVKRDEGKAIFNKDYTIYEGEADNQFYFEAGNASNNTIKIDFIEMSRVTLKSFNKICYVITIIN